MSARGLCARTVLTLALVGFSVGITAAAPPPNDACSTPTAISGTGLFPFDLTQATDSGEGQDWCMWTPGGNNFVNDVWFCWTPPCTGMAVIETCGQTTVDTRLSWYRTCTCPTPPPSQPPFCCDDDACGLQSSMNCEVECGVPVLIRVGAKPGTPPGTGFLQITCNGSPCPPCDSCCGKRPDFLSRPGPGGTAFTGGVAVMTQQAGILARVVDYIDISSQPPTGTGTNWYAPFYTPTGLQDWSQPTLGTVFGVTLDDLGNTYVAHTSVYGDVYWGPGDVLGIGGPGAIYKIDTGTGIASVFATLPNNYINNCATPPTECWPGLGNLCFSCVHKNLYVSNHEDGRIYRLDTSGTILSTYLHATGTILPGLPPPDPNGFVPLWSHPITQRGQRVWAVQTNAGRLYYSVWREDWGRPAPGYNNEIWSVGLFPNGDFIPGSEQLELTMPSWGANNWSSPVSDISFKPGSCCMLLAERSMQDDTTSYAHQSRLLEYCKTNGVWTPSGVTFQSGAPAPAPPAPDSSAGGCDYDHATGAGVNVNVWVTSDYMKYPPLLPFGNEIIYGLGGMQFTGTNPYANGLMIDSDNFTLSIDKFLQGEVEITCPQATPAPCEPDPSGQQCMNDCTIPGAQCVPVEITRGPDGVYRITRCDCLTDGVCRLQYNGPQLPPTCIDPCQNPGMQQCMPITRTAINGITIYTCDCRDTAPLCQPVSVCNPDQPGTCTPSCEGPCPDGRPCIPVEIREYPAGSGLFTITQCDCTDSGCHPVVMGQEVLCAGSCPAPNGGLCNISRTVEPPGPDGNFGVIYRCACDCRPPPPNMVDWWPMNSLMPVRDRANFLNHGTPIGGVSVVSPPLSCAGQGLSFNGSTGFVSVPNSFAPADINFGLGDFSIEGWVRINLPAPGFQPILDKRVIALPNVTGYLLFVSNGNLGFQFGSGPFATFITTGLPNIADGQCHHVAATVKRGNPNQIRLYVDGVFQAFNNASVLGSVNSAANLLFGRDYDIPLPHYLSGVLDEWEFFRRVLTQQEIVDLYNARHFAKCCEVCYTPPVVFCRTQTSARLCFQVCNYCDTEASYSWSLNGPIGGAGCSATGPITFTPASGVTGFIPPGQCRTICVNVQLPTGMPIPPPAVTACYQLALTNLNTGRQFACTNTVSRSRSACIKCNPPCDIHTAVVGTTRTFLVGITNEANPSGVIDYAVRAYYANGRVLDEQAIAINGLPPGEPVINSIAIPVGDLIKFPIEITALESEPFQVIEIVLEADTDGDGVPDPGEVIPIRAVECGLAMGGDMNEDGVTNADDVHAFVRAVIGVPDVLYHVVLADLNCDGHADGRDCQPFVNAILTAP